MSSTTTALMLLLVPATVVALRLAYEQGLSWIEAQRFRDSLARRNASDTYDNVMNGVRRASSWIITLCTSAVLTLASAVVLPHVAGLLVRAAGPCVLNGGAALCSTGLRDVAAFLEGDSVFTRVIATFFVSALATDLAVGMDEYAEHLRVLEGFVHHAFYCALLVVLLTWGGTTAVVA